MDNNLLKREEKAVFQLRELYTRYGYLPYKMSKFEEYELYIHNRDFLVSDRIITFNDTNGRLLALKPDVTLSIIKNSEDIAGYKQKVYYNENVYRVSQSTNRYKEIMQTGLECLGSIDLYDIFEVLTLASQSLAAVGEDFVLDISHQGLLNELIVNACDKENFKTEAIGFIAEKNAHDLKRLCKDYWVNPEDEERLLLLISSHGARDTVLNTLKEKLNSPYLEQLTLLSDLLKTCPYSDSIRFDFSVVNDMSYYTGIVFRGFLSGIANGVLAGGEYDKLMHKMGRSSGAVGFAIYLDMLEQLGGTKTEYDVDVLLVYDETVPYYQIAQKVNQLIAAGLSVSAQKTVPEHLRYKKITDMRGEKR